MGQRDPAVYRRHYMPDFIDRDCQAIYLGTIPQDDLIRRVGRIPYNLNVPTTLTDAQESEIRNDPELRRLCQKRQRVCEKIKRNFSTIKAAEGTPQYRKQQKLQNRINSLRQKLSNQRLAQAVDDFWKMADTDAVNKQLQGIIPSAEVLTPPMIEHELNERAAVAKLFFQCHFLHFPRPTTPSKTYHTFPDLRHLPRPTTLSQIHHTFPDPPHLLSSRHMWLNYLRLHHP